MSIASEIERLQKAKADLKTAIKAKGVEVLDTDTIDAFASKVEAIESSGGDSWYDTFWDNFQQNGERTNYAHAFAYGWNEDNFYPKYDINPQSGESMFAYFLGEIDLEQKLKECGVILDTKNCTNFNYTFWHSNIETIPVIDCSSVSTLNRTFAYCEKLKTIRKIIWNKNITYNAAFSSCPNLENLIVEGEIGKNFEVSHSNNLSMESVDSVIACLVDLTGTTAQTLRLHADVKAKLTEAQLVTITGKNWTLA